MADCGLITAGVTVDCNDLPKAGTKEDIIINNFAEISGYTQGPDSTITAITKVATKVGYKFEGYRSSVAPESTFEDAGVGSGYNHKITFTVFNVTQTQKNLLEQLEKGRYTVSTEGTNKRFEHYGKDVGMRAVEITRINNDRETGGAFRVVMSTPPEDGLEPKLPLDIYDTDYATSKAIFDGLLS